MCLSLCSAARKKGEKLTHMLSSGFGVSTPFRHISIISILHFFYSPFQRHQFCNWFFFLPPPDTLWSGQNFE